MATNKLTPELIAPCGMNCALCKAYLAYTHGIPRERGKVTHCAGCLPRAKNCYIKRGCKKLSKNQIQSCHQCDTMPCKNLDHLDRRYREHYGMSMVENLKTLKAKGMDVFLASQAERHKCPNCGDVVCVHDGKCYTCGYRREKTGAESPKKATNSPSKKQRKAVLEKTFGIDRDRIKPFSNEDREGTPPTIKEAIEAGAHVETTLEDFHKDRRELSKKAED